VSWPQPWVIQAFPDGGPPGLAMDILLELLVVGDTLASHLQHCEYLLPGMR